MLPASGLVEGADYTPAAVSLVVPVHNDQPGADRILTTLFAISLQDPPNSAARLPGEVILVDCASRVPLVIPESAGHLPMPVRLVTCGARSLLAGYNAGALTADRDWLAFLGSHCDPDPDFLANCAPHIDGATGYAGVVLQPPLGRRCAVVKDFHAREGIPNPPPAPQAAPQHWAPQAQVQPNYLPLAFCLVLRRAFLAAEAFDPSFTNADAASLDFALRLRAITAFPLRYAWTAGVWDCRAPGLLSFLGDWYRRGCDQQRLIATWGAAGHLGRPPRRRHPPLHRALAMARDAAYWAGCAAARPVR